jgi:hypothetical protein
MVINGSYEKSPQNLKVENLQNPLKAFKGIVSRDWKGLQMFSLNRFEV